MAVYFQTSFARALLDAFDERIKQDHPSEKITTWEKSDDGKFYTHKSAQWGTDAWFRATAEDERLRFNIIRPKNKDISAAVYAFYHGHLIETFLSHFDERFSQALATALPSKNDLVNAK